MQTHLLSVSSSKALSLSITAKDALAKNSPESIQQAISILQQVIHDPSFRRLDSDTKVQIFLNLSTAYQKNGLYDSQKTLITSLLQDNAFTRYWTELKVHLAHSLLDQNNIQDADSILSELLREPNRRLSHASLQEISALFRRVTHSNEKLLKEATTQYSLMQYQKAKPLFEQFLINAKKHRFPYTKSTTIRDEFEAKISYLLASCYYQMRQFDDCYRILSNQNPLYLSKEPRASEAFWLSKKLFGMCCNRLGKFDEALCVFNEYLAQFPEHDEARLEALFSAIKAGDFSQGAFQEKLLETKDLSADLAQKLKRLQILYAIRTLNTARAEKLLQQSENTLSSEDLTFLRGFYFYQIKRYDDAVNFLEKSTLYYGHDAFYLLGICYFELGKQHETEQSAYFDRAESCFEELISSPECMWQEIGLSSKALLHFEQKPSSSRQEKLALLAKSASKELSDTILLKVIEDTEDLSHPRVLQAKDVQALFVQAKLNHDFEGCKDLFLALLKNENFAKNHCLLIQIIHFLQKHKSKYTLWLLQEYEKALSVKINCHNELQECAFLRAALDESVSNLFFQRFPSSIYRSDLLFVLGLKHWQQKEHALASEYFSKLLQENPTYQKRDEALYFQALCAEDPKPYYTELYTHYPESKYAPECYFRMFAENEYVQGDAIALLHLKRTPTALQKGPFWILTCFYIAQNIKQECPEKNLSDAQILLMQEALKRYDIAINEAKTAPIFFEKISYSARLERAKTMVIITNSTTQSKESFTECLDYLGYLKELLHKKIAETDDRFYYSLWQESSRLRYSAFLLAGEQSRAREELVNLIDYAKKWNFLQTDAAVFGICELATLHMQLREFAEAESLLTMAEAAHAENENRVPLLQIWITKSALCRKKQKLDEAMTLLSKVINDDCVSSLRVQAMYLRSELYEQKGRRDLALKQLEACSSKGGAWAEAAKRKLEVQYGYE